MRVGDTVEVQRLTGEVHRGKVLASSDVAYLDYKLPNGRGYYVGVSQLGNPRVKIVKRGRGTKVATPEWRRA